MNDPLRVAREGPFWASMFVVLGAVVGFGGTIEASIYFLSGRPRCTLETIVCCFDCMPSRFCDLHALNAIDALEVLSLSPVYF